MHGIVIRNTGSWYEVRTDDGRILECKVKGNFRLRGIRSTNPVAVGDGVTVREGAAGEAAFITELGQTPEDGGSQGGLACRSPWGHEESDTTW